MHGFVCPILCVISLVNIKQGSYVFHSMPGHVGLCACTFLVVDKHSLNQICFKDQCFFFPVIMCSCFLIVNRLIYCD